MCIVTNTKANYYLETTANMSQVLLSRQRLLDISWCISGDLTKVKRSLYHCASQVLLNKLIGLHFLTDEYFYIPNLR